MKVSNVFNKQEKPKLQLNCADYFILNCAVIDECDMCTLKHSYLVSKFETRYRTITNAVIVAFGECVSLAYSRMC